MTTHPTQPADTPSWHSLYPFESHYLAIDKHKYHYVDEGTGDSVLMIHGNPTWSFYYRNLIAALRNTHRAIAPDHIGCGLSDKPSDDSYPYTLEQRIADLESLLLTLDLRKITLVVHDWGGIIGLGCALRHLDRFDRIVVLNTAAFLLPPGKRFPWQLWLIKRTPLLPALFVRGLNGFALGASMLCTTQPMSKPVRAGYLAPYDSWNNRIATLRFVQNIPRMPTDPSYATARWIDEHVYMLRQKPLFIAWGMRDFIFDQSFLAEWQRRFPHAQVQTYEHAGHYLLEDADEDLIPRIKQFIAAGSEDSKPTPRRLTANEDVRA